MIKKYRECKHCRFRRNCFRVSVCRKESKKSLITHDYCDDFLDFVGDLVSFFVLLVISFVFMWLIFVIFGCF